MTGSAIEKGRPGMRWTLDDVIAAALATLEEDGLEGLSLRGVARALGAHLNSVSWYVKTKQSLIDTMADAIIGTVRVDDLPADPIERVRVVVGRYRAAMLSHRDGGRLVAGTFTGTGNTFRVAEVIVDALLKAGYSDEDAARLCWALVYFTLGLTQEQQTSPPEADAAGVDFAVGSYPALAKVGVQLLVNDSFDARFDFGLARLLGVS
jgi:TetR/AcrR family tetracycline transcriptional repressor